MAILLTYIGVNSWLLTRGIRKPAFRLRAPPPFAESLILAVQHQAYPYVDCKSLLLQSSFNTTRTQTNNSLYYDNRPTRVSQPSLLICWESKRMRSSGPIAASTAWIPLLYDTVAIGLTLYRTARALYTKSAGQILRVMLQEGLLYYRYDNLAGIGTHFPPMI